MEVFPVGASICVILAIVIAIWVHRGKKRTEALQAVASSLIFSFSKKADKSFVKMNSLDQFHLFSRGHSRKVLNVMTGRSKDIEVMIMDYWFTTGGGNNSRRWGQTITLFQCSRLRLPSFVVRPENIFHRVGSVFGYKDIDIDSHPTFSKQYLLRGVDEEAVRKLFAGELLKYYDDHNGLSTEGDGDRLIFYRSSRRVPPDGIQSFLEEGHEIVRLYMTEV